MNTPLPPSLKEMPFFVNYKVVTCRLGDVDDVL